MSDVHRKLEDALKIAKYKGCVIVHPSPRELFIDLDSSKPVWRQTHCARCCR